MFEPALDPLFVLRIGGLGEQGLGGGDFGEDGFECQVGFGERGGGVLGVERVAGEEEDDDDHGIIVPGFPFGFVTRDPLKSILSEALTQPAGCSRWASWRASGPFCAILARLNAMVGGGMESEITTH
jgi:hypothetical protein